ncbi:hypothetical protein OBBRIDRAFT_803049 [Obba rivulosa]|uniref:Uncharacterized protein n=1 Tax=Obba rivulosa TaxID=1052685 RepID=A0A8E2AWG0_9APHY|nr:hypothetical protein OBBRIDRAFT_803049 [Obba rivulosa]
MCTTLERIFTTYALLDVNEHLRIVRRIADRGLASYLPLRKHSNASFNIASSHRIRSSKDCHPFSVPLTTGRHLRGADLGNSRYPKHFFQTVDMAWTLLESRSAEVDAVSVQGAPLASAISHLYVRGPSNSPSARPFALKRIYTSTLSPLPMTNSQQAIVGAIDLERNVQPVLGVSLCARTSWASTAPTQPPGLVTYYTSCASTRSGGCFPTIDHVSQATTNMQCGGRSITQVSGACFVPVLKITSLKSRSVDSTAWNHDSGAFLEPAAGSYDE